MTNLGRFYSSDLKLFGFVIFPIAIFSFLSYGLNSWFQLIYNFEQSYTLANIGIFDHDLEVMLMGQGGVFLRFMLEKFYHLFHIPAFFIPAAVLIRAASIFAVFKVAEIFFNDRKAAIIIGVVFSLAVNPLIHGLILNGFWGELVFTRCSISFLLSMVGIWLSLRSKVVLGSIMFALSLHFHANYGVTALAFFVPAYLVGRLIHSRSLSLSDLAATAIIVANILFFAGSNAGIPSSSLSFDEWMMFINKTDADDVSLLYSLKEWGYGIVLICGIGLFVALRNIRDDSWLSALVIGSSLSLGLFSFVEWLHNIGVSFGKISELFVALQIRRGVWVPSFFACLLIWRQIYDLQERSAKMGVSVLFIGLLLSPDISTLAAFSLLGLVFYRKPIILAPFLIGGIFYFVSGHGLLTAYDVKRVVMFAVLVATGVFGFWRLSLTRAVALQIVAFLFVSSLYGIYSKRFSKSVAVSTNRGFFQEPNFFEFTFDEYQNQGNNLDQNLIWAVRNANTNRGVVLGSPLSYGDKSLYDAPVFISTRDIAMAMFAKEMANAVDHRLREIGTSMGKLLSDDGFNKGVLHGAIRDGLATLTLGQLRGMKESYGSEVLVIDRKREDLPLIYSNNSQYVYSLKEL